MTDPNDLNIAQLVLEKRKLEELVQVHERTVQEQSQRLSEALQELQQRAKAIENSQEALARQSQVLSSVINSIASGIVVANAEGRLILFNPAAEELLGFGLTDTPLEKWSERYGCYLADKTTHYPSHQLPLARALKGETLNAMPVYIRNVKKPQGLLLSVNATPFYDAHGSVQGGVVIFHDMTEKKIAEEALRKSERRFADLFLGAADPIVILDTAGRVMSMNPMAERVSGYREADFIGKTFVETGVILPSSIDKAIREFTRVVLQEEVHPYELEIGTRSGEVLIFEAHARLLRNASEAAGVQVIFRDITHRKHAEKRSAIQYAVTRVLAESSRKEDVIARVMEAAGESLRWDFGAMWEVDSSMNNLKLGQVWHSSAYETPEFAVKTLEYGEGLPGKSWETNQPCWIEEIFHDPQFVRGSRVQGKIHSGFCFPVRVGAEVAGVMEFFSETMEKPDPDLLRMFDSIGAQIGQFLERRQAEQALMEKQVELAKSHAECEQLEIFAYVASHDLQEPLQKILAYTHFLKTDTDTVPSDRSKEYLGKLENASIRMSHLIADLLKFIKASSKESVPERVNLNITAQEVLKDYEEEIQKAGARVECGPLPVLKADARQMSQLFQNLISNALKFRKKNETLHLIISSRDAGPGHVEILVQDNGVGFDDKHRDRLFKPFERLHSWQEYKGSGIGLAICRKIAERHRGTIQAESSEGKGTAFFIRLPLA